MITNKPSILQMCLMAEVKILGLMQNPMAKIASRKSFKERLNCSIFIFAIVLALGEEADFEALNCQTSTKVDTR
jgi:hypothetical protein